MSPARDRRRESGGHKKIGGSLMSTRRHRKGNIPIVVGLVTCLGVFAYASIFMSSTGARMERRASLEQVAHTVATAAIEETLVKLQNGVAPWKKVDRATDKAVKVFWPAAATSMMYARAGIKVQPVGVMARAINELPENESKNRFYSRFAALPNYHAQHQEGWESKLTGAAAELVKPPAGVTINRQIATQHATQFKEKGGKMRDLAKTLPVLAVGRDHSDAELAEFKRIVNGGTLLRELAEEPAPRAQAVPPPAGGQAGPPPLTPPPVTPPAPLPPAPLVPGGAAGRSGEAINPAGQPGPGSLDGAGLGAGQQTGDNGCAPPTAALGAIQGPTAVVAMTDDEQTINPKNPAIQATNGDATKGKVFANAPFLVTLETKVEVPDSIMSTITRPAYAQRIVAEYQFEEASKHIAGRIVGYWMAHNNLTLNDAYRMGWVTSTSKPEGDFKALFPQTSQVVPGRAYQVWPFTIADSNTAAKIQ
jgi:hypothetical protein